MSEQIKSNNEYRGYSLFNDVEDSEIRNYNRARIMNNMYEDTADKEGNITPKGVGMIIQYFDQVDPSDRADVHARLTKIIEDKQKSQVIKRVD